MDAFRSPLALALAAALALSLAAEVVPRYGTGASPASGLVEPLPTFLIYEDGAYYLAAIQSMLRDRDLDLKNNFSALGNQPQSSVALGRHGEWYPKHPILLPLAGLPFYAAAGDRGLLAINVLQLIALALLMWTAARRFAGDGVAAAVTLLFGLATLLRPAAYHFSPDVLTAAFLLGAYVALMDGRDATAGLLAGLSIWAKLPSLAIVPLLAVACVHARGWRGAAIFTAAATGPLLIVAALNAYMFGSPFVTGYDRVIGSIQDTTPIVLPSHRTFFDMPFWSGLRAQLFDRRLGLLTSLPFAVLVPFGLAILWRRERAQALMVGGVIAAQLAFFATYRYWNVANFGARFLLPAIVFCVMPLAALAARILAVPDES